MATISQFDSENSYRLFNSRNYQSQNLSSKKFSRPHIQRKAAYEAYQLWQIDHQIFLRKKLLDND